MNSVKLQDPKISIKKPGVILYTNNKPLEREIEKTIPFIIISQTIRYPGMYVTKEMKDLYTGNYRP